MSQQQHRSRRPHPYEEYRRNRGRWRPGGTLKTRRMAWTKVLVKVGKIEGPEGAERCFERIPKEVVDVFHYSVLLKVYVRARDLRRAEGLFEKMRRAGIDPDDKTFNTLLSVYVATMNVDKAEDVLTRIRRAGIDPDDKTFNTLLSVYVATQNETKAETVLRRMDRAGIPPNATTLTSLIQLLSLIHI